MSAYVLRGLVTLVLCASLTWFLFVRDRLSSSRDLEYSKVPAHESYDSRGALPASRLREEDLMSLIRKQNETLSQMTV